MAMMVKPSPFSSFANWIVTVPTMTVSDANISQHQACPDGTLSHSLSIQNLPVQHLPDVAPKFLFNAGKKSVSSTLTRLLLHDHHHGAKQACASQRLTVTLQDS